MGAYHNLSEKLQQRIIEDRKEHRANPYAFFRRTGFAPGDES